MTTFIGRIPDSEIEADNIRWLVIVPQIHNNAAVGYYMNFHESLEQASKRDNWYKQLDHAFSHGEDYGVKRQDWKEITAN